MSLTGRFLRAVFVSGSADFIRTACERIESEPGLIVVATADTGFAAFIAVDVLRPDLVLMDAGMPEFQAIEATRRIKARFEPPVVVLITSHALADFAETARDAGADAVISKRELGESAECILRAFGARPESFTDAGSPRPSV